MDRIFSSKLLNSNEVQISKFYTPNRMKPWWVVSFLLTCVISCGETTNETNKYSINYLPHLKKNIVRKSHDSLSLCYRNKRRTIPTYSFIFKHKWRIHRNFVTLQTFFFFLLFFHYYFFCRLQCYLSMAISTEWILEWIALCFDHFVSRKFFHSETRFQLMSTNCKQSMIGF